MHDPWTDRLSDYIDGELSAADAERLERHLLECDDCLATLAELRNVMAAADAVEDSEPAADLWPGIAAAIAARPQVRAGEDVIELHSFRPRQHGSAGRRRGYSFSMPQLAAAAVLLMSLSAGAAWWLAVRQPAGGPEAGTIVHAAGAAPSPARLVDTTDPELPGAGADNGRATAGEIAELEQALDETRARLDPATVDVIERSLEAIDQAIATARAALDADPGNPHLGRQLDNAMRKKFDILRRASHVQRAGI